MLQELKNAKISVPEFYLVSDSKKVKEAVKILGYPEKKVIFKPRRSTCAKGLWIIDADANLIQKYPAQRLTLSALLSLIRDVKASGKNIPDYIVMQYLEGDDYSIDVLAYHGSTIAIIPRKRIHTVEGISQFCEFVDNDEVNIIVKEVIKKFNLHLNVNIQLRYSELIGGNPMIYEINPRISGSIVTNNGIGINLLYYGILLALNKKIPDINYNLLKCTQMYRYWVEKYITFNDKILTYDNI
jgi:carbamoyl-phosphate synthase large subunit